MNDAQLILTVLPGKIMATYHDGAHEIFTRELPFGSITLDELSYGPRASALLTDSVSHILHVIALYDRIPTHICVRTPTHGTWYAHHLSHIDYTHFFTNGKEVHVTLEHTNVPLPTHYERYKKIIDTFAF